MDKKIALSAIRAAGFIPEEIEDFGYRFEFEGLALLFPEEDNDVKSLTLCVPNICNISEMDRTFVLETMAKVCENLRYVQPLILFEDQMWLHYQHYLGDGEVTPEIVEHMVRTLGYATAYLQQNLSAPEVDDEEID